MNAFTQGADGVLRQGADYHLPLAIDLLADIFINSLFNLDDIDKEKSVVLQEISMVEDTPTSTSTTSSSSISGRALPGHARPRDEGLRRRIRACKSSAVLRGALPGDNW